ncbi:MAG TPA: hypothetical protein DGG94_14700 [Micromonosporaceae bacterium]|nr:hypothetical protein [Micromonosporaceae bacterium]HCU51023.1 hypothetical protein [Micromonosporaceae bacterium]
MLAVMHEIAHLAGFFAAHGIWSVSDGETLVPLLGYEHVDGSRGMDRFAMDDMADGAQVGQEALRENRNGSARAVLVVDAYLHLDVGRVDALIVEAVEYGPSNRSLKMGIPYRPQPSPQGFAVHRPKFIEVIGFNDNDYAELGDAFFAGVDAHEQAAAVWNAHLDPSV